MKYIKLAKTTTSICELVVYYCQWLNALLFHISTRNKKASQCFRALDFASYFSPRPPPQKNLVYKDHSSHGT